MTTESIINTGAEP